MGLNEIDQPVWFNLVDGIIKMAIFLLYLVIIGSFSDVKRVFQYHGAEHMAVSCFEAKKKLTVENVKKFPTAHARCGTTFLLMVFFVSVVLFSFLPSVVQSIFPSVSALPFWSMRAVLFLMRIVFIFPIAAVSYEFLRLGAHQENTFSRALAWPGIMVQKLTTRTPDKKQIEVAIAALGALLKKEKMKY